MNEGMADRIRGCFLGLAVGDALGMPVETMPRKKIIETFGSAGITDYLPPVQTRVTDTAGLPPGSWTDDTQLTLTVARGIMGAHGFDLRGQAHELVEAWLSSNLGWGKATNSAARQLMRNFYGGTGPYRGYDVPAAPEPGADCGNGVAMKVAPLAIWCFAGNGIAETNVFIEQAMRLGLMTHGDPRASFAAIAIGAVVGAALDLNNARAKATPETLRSAFWNVTKMFVYGAEERYADLRPNPEKLSARLKRAKDLMGDPDRLREEIRTGCFALESVPFAIATYLRHPLDFEAAVLEAVNAGGDTDTTASMVGAMAGAASGLAGIPRRLVSGLRDADIVLATANDFIAALDQRCGR